MSLSDVITSLPHETITINRKGAGSYGSDGLYTGGTTESLSIQAIVYPPKSKELELLPEGSRNKITIGLLTKTELKIASSSNQGDRFDKNGQTFEVQSVSGYGLAGLYQAIAVCVEAP